MRREFICGTVLATLVAAGVAAQTPEQDRSPGSPTGARTVTVTGCLQSATAGGEQPNAGDASSRQFTLTNATMGGTGATGTGGTAATTSGTTGGAAATRAGATSFRLTGGGNGLQQYVNSRVEVTGTIQRGSGGEAKAGSQGRPGSSAGTATGSSAGAGSTASSGQAGDQAVQTLRIASVKQVSESCSGEGR